MAAKYGSQVIFGRIHHTAAAMRHLQVLWDTNSEICRYYNHNTGVCERDTKKVTCHWSHCTVNEDTEDSIPYHEQGLG